MKTVFVINQKGGVGKSILADHLAWSLEHTQTPYSFFDLDSQGGIMHQTTEDPNAIITIVDTPGALQPQMREWISGADCILIPTRMTTLDMQPLQRMISLVSEKQESVIYVLNGYNRYKMATEFEKWFREYISENGSCSGVYTLPQAEVITQAVALKKSVLQYAPRSTAAKAMSEIINAVRRKTGIPEEIFK